MDFSVPNRRRFVKSSVFGVLALSSSAAVATKAIGQNKPSTTTEETKLFYRYPALDDESVSAVVGASHTNLKRVKELVSNRPELANAAWDWGFGDWESAIGAAAHMGRKDIVEFLLSYGARPDHFTFAMLGELEVLEAMITARPGLQRVPGPHGIPLLQHVEHRFWHKGISTEDGKKINSVIAYLKELGDAGITAVNLELPTEEKEVYLGEYRFGDQETEVFVVEMNKRNQLSIARKGNFGRTLNRRADHIFSPGGAPSVQISFMVEDKQAIALTIHEPEPLVTAPRV